MDNLKLNPGKNYDENRDLDKSNYYHMISGTSRSKNFETPFTQNNTINQENTSEKKGPVFNINLNSLTINNNVNNTNLSVPKMNTNESKEDTQKMKITIPKLK